MISMQAPVVLPALSMGQLPALPGTSSRDRQSSSAVILDPRLNFMISMQPPKAQLAIRYVFAANPTLQDVVIRGDIDFIAFDSLPDSGPNSFSIKKMEDGVLVDEDGRIIKRGSALILDQKFSESVAGVSREDGVRFGQDVAQSSKDVAESMYAIACGLIIVKSITEGTFKEGQALSKDQLNMLNRTLEEASTIISNLAERTTSPKTRKRMEVTNHYLRERIENRNPPQIFLIK